MFNTQKKYFEKKLEGVQKMVWDLEFKRFKTLEIREEVRQEYDNLKSKRCVVETQLEGNPKDKATLEDSKTILTRDIDRLEGQMKSLDMEVFGSKATAEYPNGYDGINQQLDALHELKEMLKSYIKGL